MKKNRRIFPPFKTLIGQQGSLWLSWLLIIITISQIQTYISSMDPATYISLALDLLDFGSARFRTALYTIMPFYPAILAMSIKIFGIFAPYWVNFFFLLGLIWLLRNLLRRWLVNPWAVSWSLLTTVVIILFGAPTNPQALLYPFRETSAFFFSILGLFWLQSSYQKQWHRFWLQASGGAFLLATLAREPSIIMAGCAVLFILFTKIKDNTTPTHIGPFARLFYFLVPFLIAILAWLAIATYTGSLITGQMNGWLYEVTADKSLATIFSAAHIMILKMANYSLMECGGWFGLGLFLLGVWRLKGQHELWFWFLLPAILLLVFYGFYEANTRYLLGSLLLIGPIVGYGIFSLFQIIWLLFPRTTPVKNGAQTIALIALFGFGLFRLAPEMGGQHFTRANVQSFTNQLNKVIREHDIVLLELRCYDAGTALINYTRTPVGAWELLPKYLEQCRRVIYFEPLNNACIITKRIHYDRRFLDGNIQANHLLIPIIAPNGEQITLKLGAGEYALWQILGPACPGISGENKPDS